MGDFFWELLEVNSERVTTSNKLIILLGIFFFFKYSKLVLEVWGSKNLLNLVGFGISKRTKADQLT